AFCKDGTGHGSAEKIGMLVDGASAKSRPDEVAHEFFAEVFDGGGRSASGEGLLLGGMEVFLLADVADHGDDFAAVIFLEPGNDDAGIEPTGIGEHDFFRFCSNSIHNSSFVFRDMRSLRQQNFVVMKT